MSGVWLAIDTATDIASVAAGRIPALIAGAHSQGARRHTAQLLGLIEFVLRRAEVRPADLEGLVIGDGPGSFTGLRIGWATAKGLAQEAGLDVRAIPSLMAAAAGASVRLGDAPVAACFDALRGEVFGAVYRFHADRVEVLVTPAVGTIAELARRAPEIPRAVVGDGAVKYAAEVRAWCGADPVAPEQLPPSATQLLALAGREGAARIIDDVGAAEPAYGRSAEAQVKWEHRHGRALPDSTGTER
ncbi:MAG TPA: tRNA (adenosine(37)-N6)-threonylcarbamoyltransferase complex dimerization subunit type 1 TsaB [Gemmatimonadales bacterium]